MGDELKKAIDTTMSLPPAKERPEDPADTIERLTKERDAAKDAVAILTDRLEDARLVAERAEADADADADAAQMREALDDLIGAARGMPISHDNLCQGTLNHAIEEADKALASNAGAKAAKVLKAAETWGEYMSSRQQFDEPEIELFNAIVEWRGKHF